jgi:hypothetical protein
LATPAWRADGTGWFACEEDPIIKSVKRRKASFVFMGKKRIFDD